MKTRLQAANSKSNDDIPNISVPTSSKPNVLNTDGQLECRNVESQKSNVEISGVQIKPENNIPTDIQTQPKPKPNRIVSSTNQNESNKERNIKVCLKSIIKPSRNPFINFVKAFTKELKRQYGGNFPTGKECLCLCSAKWKSLSEIQKKPFKDLAKSVPYVKRSNKKHKLRRRHRRESTSLSTDTSDTHSHYTRNTRGTRSTRGTRDTRGSNLTTAESASRANSSATSASRRTYKRRGSSSYTTTKSYRSDTSY